MTVLGLHHISIVSADAQRTVDFYTQLLGLRLVKKTVNFDDPSAYHLYFGDQTGSPGNITSFYAAHEAGNDTLEGRVERCRSAFPVVVMDLHAFALGPVEDHVPVLV